MKGCWGEWKCYFDQGISSDDDEVAAQNWNTAIRDSVKCDHVYN